MTLVRRAIGLLLPLAGLAPAAAQAPEPLGKAELVRLLVSPLAGSEEVVAALRRSCLSFRPTSRDWEEIRALQPPPEVLTTLAACQTRPSGGHPPGAPSTPAAPGAAPSVAPAGLYIVLPRPHVTAAAGGVVSIPVLAAAGGIPQPGVGLVLRGSAAVAGQTADLMTVTDDSGFAAFALRVGRRLTTHRLEVTLATGAPLPGRPSVDLTVRPGPPALVRAEPRQIFFEPGLDTLVPVTIVLRDSVGHPLAQERVTLLSEHGNPALAAEAVTDSLGRAGLVVSRGRMPATGTVQVLVRGTALASIQVLVGPGLSEAETGFAPPATTRGLAGTKLGTPVIFRVRARAGGPAPGRPVRFRAVNAAVTPVEAVTDSVGEVALDVTLGERAGSALIVGSVESLERLITLRIEPGPATELILEHDGRRVDGELLVIPVGTTWTLRVRARDAYGNAADVSRIAARLLGSRDAFNARYRPIRLVAAEPDGLDAVLTFQTLTTGHTNLTITMGLSATVRIETVRDR